MLLLLLLLLHTEELSGAGRCSVPKAKLCCRPVVPAAARPLQPAPLLHRAAPEGEAGGGEEVQ